MDYSLLVGIHRCSDPAQTADEVPFDDKPTPDLPDASASVFVVKSSSGMSCFIILFDLHFVFKEKYLYCFIS